MYLKNYLYNMYKYNWLINKYLDRFKSALYVLQDFDAKLVKKEKKKKIVKF